MTIWSHRVHIVVHPDDLAAANLAASGWDPAGGVATFGAARLLVDNVSYFYTQTLATDTILSLIQTFCAGKQSFYWCDPEPVCPGYWGYGGGFGGTARGGVRGRILTVTNTNDSGAGSLRAAVEASGPRIVIVQATGIIDLVTPIWINNPDISIVGALGGFCLRNEGLIINTSNVVVQNLRSRPGAGTTYPDSSDALTIVRGSQRILVDHCSLSWSVDELLDCAGANVTIQWCILSEGLWHSVHPDGNHSMGPFLYYGADRVTLHHNLIAHNADRNIAILSGHVEVVNNVIYNYGNPITVTPWTGYPVRGVFLGNAVIPGPSTSVSEDRRRGLWLINAGTSLFDLDAVAQSRIYEADNQSQLSPFVIETPGEQSLYIVSHESPSDTFISQHYETPAAALVSVLAGAGAMPRDTVDARVVDDVINGTGSLIDDPTDVDGWPEL